MINHVQIQRLVQLGLYRQLIERILPSGRCRSRQAVSRLAAQESAATSAIGLALIRCCELSYLPSPLGRDLIRQLLGLRRPDRLFGEGARPSVGASAIGIRAMIEWRALCASVGELAPTLDLAIDESISALAAEQGCDGFLGRNEVGSAIALSILGDCEEFRSAIEIDRLRGAIDRSDAISVDLSRYAHAMAA